MLLILCVAFSSVRAGGSNSGSLEVAISIDPATASATVVGKWPAGMQRRNLSFAASAIGAPNLGRRVSDVRLTDADGKSVPFKAFNPAEYVAERDFVAFRYALDLKPFPDPRAAAHCSWIGVDEGLILPEDLLPIVSGGDTDGADISMVVSGGWELAGADVEKRNGVYRLDDIGRSALVIGKRLRKIGPSGTKPGLSIALSGTWLFGDQEAEEMSDGIYNAYKKIFTREPTASPLVVILPLPNRSIPKGFWEAETRGSTVVITSSDMPFKAQSVQRLHEQLRHEIFHLWLPNGVNLTGRYDWFYEGFALYESLKIAVAMNRIRFEDMLDTITRAHELDASSQARRSLIEVSEGRWFGSETQLYARGIVVAFLTDVILLKNSQGRDSVEEMISRFFVENASAAGTTDGSRVALELYNLSPELRAFAVDHIQGAKLIAWNDIIGSAGLEADHGSPLRVKERISGRQRVILDKLGYNSWRKLSER